MMMMMISTTATQSLGLLSILRHIRLYGKRKEKEKKKVPNILKCNEMPGAVFIPD